MQVVTYEEIGDGSAPARQTKKMRRDTSKQSSEHAHGLRGAVVMKPEKSLKKMENIGLCK